MNALAAGYVLFMPRKGWSLRSGFRSNLLTGRNVAKQFCILFSVPPVQMMDGLSPYSQGAARGNVNRSASCYTFRPLIAWWGQRYPHLRWPSLPADSPHSGTGGPGKEYSTYEALLGEPSPCCSVDLQHSRSSSFRVEWDQATLPKAAGL